MAQKIFNFEETKEQTQQHTINIPLLKNVNSLTPDSGTVELLSQTNDTLIVELSDGDWSRRVQTGGSTTPTRTKVVTQNHEPPRVGYQYATFIQMEGDGSGYWRPEGVTNLTPTWAIDYSDALGYSGELTRGALVSQRTAWETMPDKAPPGTRRLYSSRYATYAYSGTVTRPGTDTRTWDYFYNYSLTVDYEMELPEITSPSGGEQIDKNFTIVWTHENALANVDLEYSADGSNWVSIANDVSDRNYTHNFVNNEETSEGKIRVRASYDGAKSNWVVSDGVFTIRHYYTPQKPSNLNPSQGEVLLRLDAHRFSWVHNHRFAQSKFDLHWSDDQITWKEISRETPNQFFTMPAEIFPEGRIYWRVRTYSDTGLLSDWSDVQVFNAEMQSDRPIITSPNIINGARPLFSWSQQDQIAYQVQVKNTLNETIWDSEEVISTNKNVESGIDLINNTTYTLRVRTKNLATVWSEWTEQIITVSYTPPAIPNITLNKSEGFIHLNIGNPKPEGLQPKVLYNDIYRNGIRIATSVGNNYKDYSIRSGKEYSYKVIAIGDNDTFSESEVIEVTGSKLKGIWIYDIDNPDSLVNFKIDGGGRNESREVEHSFFKFAGRKKPVVQFGTQGDFAISANVAILRDDELKKKLDNLISKTILYRDGRGRKVYGTIPHLTYNEIRSIGYEVAINVTEIDYTEEV